MKYNNITKIPKSGGYVNCKLRLYNSHFFIIPNKKLCDKENIALRAGFSRLKEFY